MAGEYVPAVMIPRYSTCSGAHSFTTLGMDVSNYQNAIINVWRGDLGGTSPTFGVTFQESTDQNNWSTCGGTTADADPGADTETQYNATLTKRWFRMKMTLGGTDPLVTWWGMGFLELRES